MYFYLYYSIPVGCQLGSSLFVILRIYEVYALLDCCVTMAFIIEMDLGHSMEIDLVFKHLCNLKSLTLLTGYLFAYVSFRGSVHRGSI